jgi:hypothetical protein
MPTNLDRFKSDLQTLIAKGKRLETAMQYECYPDEIRRQAKTALKDKADEFLKELPSVKASYQSWYSESLGKV